MNLIILAALIAVCGAAKLDRTYLPPASAKTAGGSPGAIQTPNSFSQNTAPKGSYTNNFQGVVVDAALAGTRASGGEESGLGGPRNSYGSTTSKVGDAAFRGSQAGFRFPVSSEDNFESANSQFGVSRDPRPERPQANTQFGATINSTPERSDPFGPSRDSTPERSQPFGVSIDSTPERSQPFGISRDRPERPQAAQERAASVLRFESEVGTETFNYAFETDNGISAEETGVATNGVQARGGFSYTGDDGKVYSVTYTADKDGYQPRGDHLPTPPPIPEEILKSLEQNARDEANGVIDDGLYDAQKYNEGGDYAESDGVNGKQNGRPFVTTGNSDVDASGSFINQNNLPFNPSNPKQQGTDNKAPVNRFQPTSDGVNRNFQSNSASSNRFGSRNEYLPPFNNQNIPQNSRPQIPIANIDTSDADSSSTFQQETTEQGSGDFPSNVQRQPLTPIRPGSSNTLVSKPTTENKFNGFKQNGASNGNQFNNNGNRFPSSQGNRPTSQSQFGGAPVNAHIGHNQLSAQPSSPSFNSQHSTSIPDTELTTPFESSPHQGGAQPSAATVTNMFGFNAQSSRPGQSQFGFQNSHHETSQTPTRPTIPSFTQSRPQNSNSQPLRGNMNTQSSYPTQVPQEQGQLKQQSESGNRRPQFTQGQFPQNSGNQFASSTQKPQFIQQTNTQDESYYYNQPSKTFNTPQTQGSRFPSAPSNQFNRVTQRPSFSSQTTQYFEEPNYPSTSSPFQTGQRQGSTRYPQPPTLPTESSPSDNQYQGTAIASTANGITQASASSFTAPTSSTGFNRQQFDQSRQKYQQPSFQSNQPSSPEPNIPFGVQTKPQPQSNRGQSQSEQQTFESVQPLSQQPLQDVKQPKLADDQNQAVTNQQYNGEIYEYNKPAEALPPPESGFGQFGQKVESSKPTQSRPQFSQIAATKPQQPTSGSFDQAAAAPQGAQYESRPQFDQTSNYQPEQPTVGSFSSQPTRFSQSTKAPQGDQSSAQTSSKEHSTNSQFNAKPSRQQFGHLRNQDSEEQSVNNQFSIQRRPVTSQSQRNFAAPTAEKAKPFGVQDGRPSCCKFIDTFGQKQNFGQASGASQFDGEGQFGSQSSFQGNSGFKPDQSQSATGKGEVFGGPRKPPSFDDSGYHY